MALAQRKASVESLWLDHLALGIGSLLRRQIRSSEDHSLFRRSLLNRLTSLVNLGAIECRGHLREWRFLR